MATPIAETPVLRGKDSLRFSEEIKKNENKRLTPEEMAKLKASYEKIKQQFAK